VILGGAGSYSGVRTAVILTVVSGGETTPEIYCILSILLIVYALARAILSGKINCY